MTQTRLDSALSNPLSSSDLIKEQAAQETKPTPSVVFFKPMPEKPKKIKEPQKQKSKPQKIDESKTLSALLVNFQIEMPEIKEDSGVKPNVMVGISYEHVMKEAGKLQTGEKLKVLIDALHEKKCDITLLLVDAPRELDLGKEKADEFARYFKEANKDIINETKIDIHGKAIPSGIKTITWNEFIKERNELYNERLAMLRKVISKTDPQPSENSELYRLMQETFLDFRKNGGTTSTCTLETSFELQLREYAGILSMHEYTHLLYPKITDALSMVCSPSYFVGIDRPQFNWYYYTFIDPRAVTIVKDSKRCLPEDLADLISELATHLAENVTSTAAKDSFIKNLVRTISVAVAHRFEFEVGSSVEIAGSAAMGGIKHKLSLFKVFLNAESKQPTFSPELKSLKERIVKKLNSAAIEQKYKRRFEIQLLRLFLKLQDKNDYSLNSPAPSPKVMVFSPESTSLTVGTVATPRLGMR